MAVQATVAKVASVALRISALLFFRFLPVHFPSITVSLFAVYVSAFLSSWFTRPPLEIVGNEVDVAVKESTVSSKTQLPQENGAVRKMTPEQLSHNGKVKIVKARETVIVREKPVQPWKVLFYGVPSKESPLLSALTFLINLALIGLIGDALYRARWYYPSDDLSFVRLGYVSPTEARFLVREPDQAKMPVTLEIRIQDPQPPFDNPQWQLVGGFRWTTNDTDYTASLTAPLIHPEQRQYEWRTSNNHAGQFLSPPKPGKMPKYNDNKFTFLSTSCILPRFPYNPLDHALAIPGLRHLAKRLPELSAQFMLFLGDFIYVDVPDRFGTSVEEYRMQYRQVYASPDWAPVGQNLSWIHVLDDHEISNDWSSNRTGVYKAAVEPWNIYQAGINPPVARAARTTQQRNGSTWFEFVQGPASFFMLDTRTYRSSNNEPFDSADKTMLGEEQLEDLLYWLARPEPAGVRWKFVASSVPFTKNWPVNVKDTWGGFLVERRKILEAMWLAGTRGTTVVILSGDRHEFAATKFPPPPGSSWPESAAAFEFSTSPLNQFASPLPTYRQTDGEDVKLKYIPSGSSKFGSFTIEEAWGQSTLKYHLYIDGKESWSTLLVAPPVPEEPSAALAFWRRIFS